MFKIGDMVEVIESPCPAARIHESVIRVFGAVRPGMRGTVAGHYFNGEYFVDFGVDKILNVCACMLRKIDDDGNKVGDWKTCVFKPGKLKPVTKEPVFPNRREDEPQF